MLELLPVMMGMKIYSTCSIFRHFSSRPTAGSRAIAYLNVEERLEAFSVCEGKENQRYRGVSGVEPGRVSWRSATQSRLANESNRHLPTFSHPMRESALPRIHLTHSLLHVPLHVPSTSRTVVLPCVAAQTPVEYNARATEMGTATPRPSQPGLTSNDSQRVLAVRASLNSPPARQYQLPYQNVTPEM